MLISPVIHNKTVSLCKKLTLALPSKSQTVGRLGEILVYRFLKEKDIPFVAKCLESSYSSYDFLVKENIKVEAKCSYPNKGNHTFIITKNKGKFDFLICVCLKENPFDEPDFYFIPREEVARLTGFQITKYNKSRYSQFRNYKPLLD